MRRSLTAVACIASLVLVGCSSSSGLDTTSSEYQQGWNTVVSFGLPDGVSRVIQSDTDVCKIPIVYKTSPNGATSALYSHWDYSDHQRKEWSHGCLDALRNLTDYKVPQQSWEN